MIYPPFKPRHCMRGAGEGGGSAEQAIVALLNNSSGAYYLVVRDFQVSQTDGDSVSTYYTQTLPLTAHSYTNPNPAAPLVPGEAVWPGQVWIGSTSAFPAADYTPLSTGQKFNFWVHDWPFAVLLPGWYLVFQDEDNAGKFVTVSFIWQSFRAEELDHYLMET